MRQSLESWKAYAGKIEADHELARFLSLNDPEDYPYFPDWPTIHRNYCLYSPLGQFVCRYIHLSGKMVFDEAGFLPIYLEWEKSLLSERLPITIWIPILMAKFDFESLPLGAGAAIESMPNELQLARNKQRSHNDPSHEVVVGAATHALVLHGWEIPNATQRERNNLLSEVSSFARAVETIDKFFAALRAVTGVSTGYSQLVVVPVGCPDVRGKAAAAPAFIREPATIAGV